MVIRNIREAPVGRGVICELFVSSVGSEMIARIV